MKPYSPNSTIIITIYSCIYLYIQQYNAIITQGQNNKNAGSLRNCWYLPKSKSSFLSDYRSSPDIFTYSCFAVHVTSARLLRGAAISSAIVIKRTLHSATESECLDFSTDQKFYALTKAALHSANKSDKFSHSLNLESHALIP